MVQNINNSKENCRNLKRFFVLELMKFEKVLFYETFFQPNKKLQQNIQIKNKVYIFQTFGFYYFSKQKKTRNNKIPKNHWFVTFVTELKLAVISRITVGTLSWCLWSRTIKTVVIAKQNQLTKLQELGYGCKFYYNYFNIIIL